MAERTEVVPMDVQSGGSPPAQTSSPRGGFGEKLGFVDSIFLAIENPVLRRELLTSLRSNKAFSLQFFFLLALGAVVYLAWPEGEVAVKDERKAMQLFRVFCQGQLVLLSVLAPAFSASAMTIEKEKKCLDLLLTSPIHLNTILIGKYLSAVLYLFMLVFSTAPIISVCYWMPGIAPEEIMGLCVLMVSVASCFGMIGLTCSVFFHRTQTSLSISYLVVLPLALVLLVFARSFDGFFALSSAIWPAGLLFAATFVMYQASLKRLHQPFNPVFKAAEEEDISTQTGLVLVRDRFPDNLLAPPKSDELLPDTTNPIYQKEIRSEIFGRGTLFLRLIIQISMFLSVVFLTFLYLQKEHIFVYYLTVFTMLVAPAFASNTFTQERERRTLEMLMTTLIRPSHVVSGKFFSCCRLSVFLTGLVGVTLIFYLLVGDGGFGVVIPAFGAYILILLATIVFETSLGMFYSLVSKTSWQSMILTYSTVLILFGLPMAAKTLLTTFSGYDQNDIAMACFTSPFQAVYSVTNKIVGETKQAEVPVSVWPVYVTFCITVAAALMGYMYATFESWATKTVRPD